MKTTKKNVYKHLLISQYKRQKENYDIEIVTWQRAGAWSPPMEVSPIHQIAQPSAVEWVPTSGSGCFDDVCPDRCYKSKPACQEMMCAFYGSNKNQQRRSENIPFFKRIQDIAQADLSTTAILQRCPSPSSRCRRGRAELLLHCHVRFAWAEPKNIPDSNLIPWLLVVKST